MLPRQVAPVTGETLISYLTRLAAANHLTTSEVLTVLPTWFTTKINNPDERAQHHMLAPATTDALHALARLTGASPAGLAHALPAFGTTDTHGPVRATSACHRCTARRRILQPVPVHLPASHKVCTRHGIWLSDAGQPHLDLAACPEIITAQHRTNRLLRRHTPQQLLLAYQAAAKSIPPWPPSPAAIPLHWRHQFLTLQASNHRYGTSTDHDAYIHAAWRATPQSTHYIRPAGCAPASALARCAACPALLTRVTVPTWSRLPVAAAATRPCPAPRGERWAPADVGDRGGCGSHRCRRSSHGRYRWRRRGTAGARTGDRRARRHRTGHRCCRDREALRFPTRVTVAVTQSVHGASRTTG